MNKRFVLIIIFAAFVVGGLWFTYSKIFVQKQERTILYWTDPMIPGDKADHPGKSPMGMDRIPVYTESANPETTHVQEKSYYTCPMHPSVRKESPGACPICGMTLVKKVEEETVQMKKSGTQIIVSPSKQILANVSTTKAVRTQSQKIIRAVGTIEYPEENFRHISSRFPGRIEKLYVTYIGQQVRSGDPVADLYSPEAISAQQEYLFAKDSYEQSKDQAESIAEGARALFEQSKQKLLLWGFSEEQIVALDSAKKAQNAITIYSPISGTVIQKNVEPQRYVAAGENLFDVADLSTVWVVANVYENEMPLLHIGQTMTASTESYPGKEFGGRISFISPTVDPSTHTVRVRAEFPNSNHEFKINMFVDVRIQTEIPLSINVPKTAVLSTGKRQVVWVQIEENIFEPRVVTTGMESENSIQILDGIDEGDVVVTSGGYLLDSESQMEATNKSETETIGR